MTDITNNVCDIDERNDNQLVSPKCNCKTTPNELRIRLKDMGGVSTYWEGASSEEEITEPNRVFDKETIERKTAEWNARHGDSPKFILFHYDPFAQQFKVGVCDELRRVAQEHGIEHLHLRFN